MRAEGPTTGVPSRRCSGAVAVALALAGFLAGLASPRAAWAWASVEHQEIGRISYAQACTQIAAAVAGSKVPDPGVSARFEIACGTDAPVLASLYGDATAIAGDFLSEPSEFMSHVGAWRFSSKKHYYLLALENSEHFNPMATRSWRAYHQRAVDAALSAAEGQGLAIVERFELAIEESAFADHFLQDSFAAGHMGFNRSASSAAAAKGFHDHWNARGRVASDRAGHRWVTFGDGLLDSQANQDSRRRVIDTATLSIHHVLLAFVFHDRSGDEALEVWRSLPFVIEAPELRVEVVELFKRDGPPSDRQLVPLLGTVRPARKDTVLGVEAWSAATFQHPSDATVAAVAGIDLAVPYLPAQGYLGGGGTLREPGGRHSGVVETGVLVPLGLSVQGLLSHQLNLTASWIFRTSLATLLHLEYQLNLELGDALISLQLGLVEFFPQARPGWYGGLGIGFTFSVAGGGGI